MADVALGVFGLSSGDLASIGRPDKTKWLCVLSINSVISYVGQDYKDDLVWEPEDCDALQAASEEFMVQHFHAIKIRWQFTRIAAMFHRMMHAFLRTCRQLTGSLKFSRPNHEQKCASVPESKYRLWRKCNKAQNTSANQKNDSN